MTDRKESISWAQFTHETSLSIWKKRAQQHRLEGCTECLDGGCITNSIKKMEKDDAEN